MKKALKIVGIIVLVIILGIVGLLTYVKTALPNVGDAPDMKVELTPERVERGKYLANHVTVCMDCHSTRDWTTFAGQMVPGTEGKGGELFDEKFGFPGSYTSKNITPYGIGDWTDGELFRVITTGVNRHGKAMFPVMPYPYYGQLDEEDIKSIIAYIRTLKPIEFKPAESHSNFPFNFIVNTIPQKANLTKKPDPSDELAYGKYMATASGCRECHSKVEKGQVIPELEYGGGREFPFGPGVTLRSANITSDMETGIGNWSKEAFIKRFKAYADSSYIGKKVDQGSFNTIMPWIMYCGMTEQDLGAIYTYLRSIKPIKNSVEKVTRS